MTNTSKIVSPLPGWLICKPYISEDQTFKNLKEEAGTAMKSEVLAVGMDYIDDHGNLRTSLCKKGDIIVHEYINTDYEQGFDKYRAVRFYQVIGILK